MRAADQAVATLVDFGVRNAFAVPGESFLAMLDALIGSPIRLTTARHEGGAGFMAEATSKLTGMPALCLATRAPGASNLAIALHTALHDSTPLLALIGQVPLASRHRDAFQEADLAAMLRPITKWSIEVDDASRLASVVREGLRRVVTGRPGPVAIVVPEDVFAESADSDGSPAGSPLPRSAAPDSAVREAIRILQEAEQPVMVVGGGVLMADAAEELIRLAELTHIPVVTAFRRHDAFPNEHELYLGSLSLGAPSVTRGYVAAADVVLALGTRLSELTTQHYTIPSKAAKLIHVDVAGDELGRNATPQVAIAADVREVLIQLVVAAEASDWRTSTRVQLARQRWLSAVQGPLEDQKSGPANPARIVAAVSRIAADRVVTSDAGNFAAWVSRHLMRSRPRTFLGPTSGAMGYAVPAAVAAAVLHGRPSVAMVGDGGFLMTGNELATAQLYGVSVCCVIFDNARYGTIQMHQEAEFPGRRIGTDLWSPDFAAYAATFGGRFFQLTNDDAVESVLEEALGTEGLTLVHVPMEVPPYLPAAV